ncbi:MAG TPA: hypothetical protein VF618_20950 [Thermoanaerobaculia bacterium]
MWLLLAAVLTLLRDDGSRITVTSTHEPRQTTLRIKDATVRIDGFTVNRIEAAGPNLHISGAIGPVDDGAYLSRLITPEGRVLWDSTKLGLIDPWVVMDRDGRRWAAAQAMGDRGFRLYTGSTRSRAIEQSISFEPNARPDEPRCYAADAIEVTFEEEKVSVTFKGRRYLVNPRTRAVRAVRCREP